MNHLLWNRVTESILSGIACQVCAGRMSAYKAQNACGAWDRPNQRCHSVSWLGQSVAAIADRPFGRRLEWVSDPDCHLCAVNIGNVRNALVFGNPSKPPASCTPSGQPALLHLRWPCPPSRSPPVGDRIRETHHRPPTRPAGNPTSIGCCRSLHRQTPTSRLPGVVHGSTTETSPGMLLGAAAARAVSYRIRCRPYSIKVGRGCSAPAQWQTSDARSRTR